MKKKIFTLNTIKLSKIILTIGLFAAVSGCSMVPKYQQPQMAAPATFDNDYITSAEATMETPLQVSAAELGWREFFTDPLLQELIETALQNNRDLRESALNVEAYQAQYRIQRAAQFPTVTVDGSGTKQRTLSSGGYATSETYSVDLGVTSYELDLYGRIKSLKDQALEQFLAMEETQRSASITMIAEVARTYLTWLADMELLQITEDTRRTEEKSYSLVKQRVDAGVANELDLAQARTSLETVKANLALYSRQVAQDRHYLALLTGANLPAAMNERTSLLSDAAIAALTPTSLSSDVLLQRPDIMAAEHELRGANANIGAARAAFFPTLRITTSAGFISTEFSSLFDSGSGAWLFSPSISLPIFTAGQLQAELDTVRIQKDIYIARYEKAIQTAFQEVSDALVAVGTYHDQLVAQEANLQANEEYYNRAMERYEEGIDSFLTLLDAQRSLYSSRQNFISQKLAQLENNVTLYKVLGGGIKE